MIKFIYGTRAAQKSKMLTDAISKDASQTVSSFLIVPEQFAVQSERAMLKELPPSAQLTLEVLNFSRLYNRVCRKYGNIEYNYITKPLRYAFMWQVLRELSPTLEVYGVRAEETSSLCDLMLSASNELKINGIDPLKLESAAKKLDKDDPLAKKLRDLTLVCAAFDGMVSHSFSDSADDISKLADTLKKHNFFENSNVYIDHFTSFTAAEYKVIAHIFAQAANVTITLPLAAPDTKEPYTLSMTQARDTLRSLCRDRHEFEEIIADTDKDAAALNEEIKTLCASLWKASPKKNKEEKEKDKINVARDGVHLIKCTSPYSEAEAAAAITLSLLREGYRCRDIVIIARDAEQYRGIIEPAFEKCSIPYYFSEKTDLAKTSLVKFMLSALHICVYGWRTSDVISHLKCALYGADTSEIDRFEQYISAWQIKGSRFLDGDFTMNPDGYSTDGISERGQLILDGANKIRAMLCRALVPLFDELEKEVSVSGKCKALYRFLDRSGVEKRLDMLSGREAERGNVREAEEYSRIFEICCDSLGALCEAMSQSGLGNDIDTKEFCDLLTVYFSKTEMGTIPTSVDQVIVGSASLMRSDSPRAVIMLGLCEGVFPAPVSEHGVLTFEEKALLSDKFEIKLSGTPDTMASDELMFVQRAVEAPSERLYMLTHSASGDGRKSIPSLPFERAKALFPKNYAEYDSRDILSLTPSLRAALPYLSDIFMTPEGKALDEVARKDEKFARLLENSSVPVSDVVCSVSDATARRVFPETFNLSQTKIDKFVSCNFSYYCTYALKLREEQISRFKANDIGTFIHHVLEKLLSDLVKGGKLETLLESLEEKDESEIHLPTKEIEEMTKKWVDEYIEKINLNTSTPSKRLEHLYRRLYSLSLLLVCNIIEEFKRSEFRPKFFELDTDGKESNPSAREFILKDGTKIVFSGTIDRVDILNCEDGRVYIRVVDYKTGTKQFSLGDVKEGFNIQMLLYLFTLTANKNDKFKELIGSDTPLEAGVMYLSSSAPPVALGDYEDKLAVFEKAQKNLKRSGLLLKDKDILLAMNKDLSPDFLAGIKETVKKELSGKALATVEDFETLKKQLDETICRIGEEMISGCANALPNAKAPNDPCEYCAMKPICRREKV